MTFDAHSNFAYTVVSVAPSPVLSGTSLTVATGTGSRFPQPPFNATVWPAASALVPLPLASNAEVVRVTALSGDVLTISRAQEGSTARTILAGDQIAAGITAKTLTDVEAAAANSLQSGNNLSDVASASTARTNLGLGSAATQASSAFDASGAASTAQAASLQKASNLSDVASAATARTNLGLGTAATQASSAFDTSGAAATAQAASLQKASNLTDVSDSEAAKWSLNVASTSAKAVATANVALSGLQTIDGYVTSATGTNGGPDTVLLTAQTTGSQNGLWLVASGAWSRPSRFPTAGVVNRSLEATIGGGSVFAGTAWVLPVTTAVTIDTTAQAWVQRPLTAAQMPSSVVSGASAGSAGGSAPTNTTLVPHPNGTGGWVWGAESGGGIDAGSNGVKADGRNITDAAITSGQPTLTSASAAFTSADTGKVFMVAGAGASGRELVATGTYVNATTITLASNAGTTVSGANCDYGTDDTAAWQALVTAVLASNSSSAMITSKGGMTMLAGAQQSGTVTGAGNYAGHSYNYSAQLLLPAVELAVGASPVLSIVGPVPPPFLTSFPYAPAHQTGLIFRSSAGNSAATDPTGPSVIGAKPSTSGFTGAGSYNGVVPTSYVELRLKNVTVRACKDPLCNGINANAMAKCSMEDTAVDIAGPALTVGYRPATGVSNCALITPCFLNDGGADMRRTQVVAFPWGIDLSEHSVLDNVYITNCLKALLVSAGTHLSTLPRVLIQDCTTHIAPNVNRGGTNLVELVGEIDFESQGMTNFIDDPSGLMHGKLVVHNGYGSTQEAQGFPVNGAYNLNVGQLRNGGQGSLQTNIKDTFTRCSDSASVLGAADVTCHPWLVETGTFGTSNGAAVAGVAGLDIAIAQNLLAPTIVQHITTGSGSFNHGCVFRYNYSAAPPSNDWIGCLLVAGTGVILQKHVGAGNAYSTLASGGVVAINTAYQLTVVVSKPSPEAGSTIITAYLNGAQVLTYTLSGAEETQYIGTGIGLIGYQDSSSKTTLFQAFGSY